MSKKKRISRPSVRGQGVTRVKKKTSRPRTISQAAPTLPLVPGHSAVCGLQWGDEGKGQIVDLLTGVHDYVVRYNGGNNAGHSVQIGEERFALHLVPSGILNPDKICVIGNGVVVDPPGILEEIKGLRERGVKVGDNLRISDRAHVVFPYHKIQDKLLDDVLGQSRGDETRIGTTGRGIGPCYADKALRSTAVRMGELLDADRLRKKLTYIVQVKNVMLAGLAQQLGRTLEPFNAEALTDEFVALGKKLAEHICDTTTLLHDQLERRRRLLFEGANAALLDVDHGTYPFVTSSSCSSLGIYPGTGVPGGSVANVIGIVKLYTSRVGGGPMPTEIHGEIGERIRQVGKEFGTTTGRPRRCGWLDLIATRYTARLSGATTIACTGLAVLTGLPTLKACVGYRYNGKTLDAFPADCDVLANLEPVYEEFPGFDEPVGDCTSYQQLPGAARRFITFAQKFIGVPIQMVCVGRRRDQILVK